MPEKIFITDFDGTLLKDDKTIAHEDIDALKQLKNYGIITCIATGRSIYSFDKILKSFNYEFNFPLDYLIFSTGAGIMNFQSREILCNYYLNESDIVFISDYFEKLQLDYMVHKPIPETHCFVYRSHGTENPDFFRRIDLYKKYALLLNKNEMLKGFGKSTQILSIIPQKLNNSMSDIIKKIRRDLAQFSVVPATSPLDNKSLWIEVFNKKVSKSKAASFLVKKLEVKKENLFAIGNDYNDMDLLQWSGKGYIVENAIEELKGFFDMVPSNNNCGVSAAIGKCINH